MAQIIFVMAGSSFKVETFLHDWVLKFFVISRRLQSNGMTFTSYDREEPCITVCKNRGQVSKPFFHKGGEIAGLVLLLLFDKIYFKQF